MRVPTYFSFAWSTAERSMRCSSSRESKSDGSTPSHLMGVTAVSSQHQAIDREPNL